MFTLVEKVGLQENPKSFQSIFTLYLKFRHFEYKCAADVNTTSQLDS